MQRFKKTIAVMLVFCMSVMLFSACPTTTAQTTDLQIDQTEQIEPMTPEQAALVSSLPETDDEIETYAYTNVAADVKWAPVWTSETIETFPAGREFNIIHREYDYYYIEYADENNSNVLNRGYVPRSCTSTVVNRWCKHNIFTTAINNTSISKSVFIRPINNIYTRTIDTIDSDEGEAANKPLIVLSRLGNYFYVQYVHNFNGGGAHMQWRRGWVYAGDISLTEVNSFTQESGKTTFYIQNVGTGRFLTLEDPNAANKSNLIIHDFEGSARQKWTLEVSETGIDNTTYVTIKTNATNSSSTGRIMSIKDALSVINTRMEIRNDSNEPSKDQEFYIKQSEYTSADGSIEYNICSRLTGNYMQLGVYADQQGNGGPVLNKYPYTTWYNRWRLIPVGGTPNVRYVHIVCDSSCTKTDTEIETIFEDGVLGFKYGFDLDFRILSISRKSFSTELDECYNTETENGCTKSCGDDPQCPTTHHRGSKRLMGTTPMTDYYTFKFVGHGLCNINEYGQHGNVNGTAYLPNGNSSKYCAIATSLRSNSYTSMLIQHELSHNLGTRDKEGCVTNSNCIMRNSVLNTWCVNCENIIDANIANYNS